MFKNKKKNQKANEANEPQPPLQGEPVNKNGINDESAAAKKINDTINNRSYGFQR